MTRIGLPALAALVYGIGIPTTLAVVSSEERNRDDCQTARPQNAAYLAHSPFRVKNMLQYRKTQDTTRLTVRNAGEVLDVTVKVAGLIPQVQVGTITTGPIIGLVEQMAHQPYLLGKTSARA